jgi:hypothetical protein
MALSKLSCDEQRFVFSQLCNVLDPGIAVALSSVSNELWMATQALKQQLKADHKAAAALCCKLGMRNCKELREAKDVRCDPRGITADDVELLGTLGSVQPALKRLYDMWLKRIIAFNRSARLGCLFARGIIIGDEYGEGHIYWIDSTQPDAPPVPFTHASLDGFMPSSEVDHEAWGLDGTDLASRLVQIYRGEVQGIKAHPHYQGFLPGMCRRYCLGVVRGWLLDTARDGTPLPSRPPPSRTPRAQPPSRVPSRRLPARGHRAGDRHRRRDRARPQRPGVRRVRGGGCCGVRGAPELRLRRLRGRGRARGRGRGRGG